jgi:RNA polymerase sigma-70 factor (ECF subfamily)
VNSDWKNESPTPSEWQRWLADHAAKFLLFARQQSRSEADAQDLVQESIVECWQRQPDGAPPALPFLFATIHRRAVDLARSQARRHRRELASELPGESWFDTSPEERERSQLVQSAMRQLPDIYRNVITLKVWGGLTFAEIAEALGIPLNTAASRYRYGLAELRKLTKPVMT